MKAKDAVQGWSVRSNRMLLVNQIRLEKNPLASATWRAMERAAGNGSQSQAEQGENRLESRAQSADNKKSDYCGKEIGG